MAAIALLGGLFLLFARSLLDNRTTVSSLLADGKRPLAPSFSLDSLNSGTTVRLSHYRHSVVLLNFWASWCDSCKSEAPVLDELATQYRARGLVVLGVDEQDLSADARGFLRHYHVDYPVVADPSGAVDTRWGVTDFPESFIIDREGRVRYHFPGPVEGPEVDDAMRALDVG